MVMEGEKLLWSFLMVRLVVFWIFWSMEDDYFFYIFDELKKINY